MKRLLLLKTHVKEYITKRGTFVPAHEDKRPSRKPKAKHPRTPSSPPPSFEQLGLFTFEPEPSRESIEPATPEQRPTTQEEESARITGIDYSQRWDKIRYLHLPVFGAQPDWTPSQRIQANREAQEVLEALERGEQPENWREKLAAYSGQGGIGDSLNEYYTRPDVAAAMWKLLARYGLEHGHVLDPCAATGVFQETKPKNVQVTAIELDGLSSSINRRLHPDDTVHTSSFEDHITTEDGRYDAVIGNVPFGVRGHYAAIDKPDLGKAEEYFLDTALDATKDYGIVAMIVPSGLSRNSSQAKFRQRVLAKASVLAVHRLPNSAFRHSGTAVTTDIVILRKRQQEVANALLQLSEEQMRSISNVWDERWVSGTIDQDPLRAFVHGEKATDWRGGETVEGEMDIVADAIAGSPLGNEMPPASLNDVIEAARGDERTIKRITSTKDLLPYAKLPDGATKMIGGRLYVLKGQPRRWHAVDTVDADTFPEDTKEHQAVKLAQRLNDAIKAVNEGLPISNLEQLREDVLRYAEQYGHPGRDEELTALARHDRRLWSLMNALDESGNPSALLRGELEPITIREKTDDPLEAWRLASIEAANAVVPFDALRRHWAGSEQALREAIYAHDGLAISLDGQSVMSRSELTSGELYPKLDATKFAIDTLDADDPMSHKLRAQAAWLEEAINPKGIEDFEVNMLSGFVPLQALSDFLTERYIYDDKRDRYYIDVRYENSVYHLETKLRPGQDVKGKWEYAGSAPRHLARYLNREALREEDWKSIEEIESEFKDWLATHETWRDIVEDEYNRRFNSYRERQYSDEPFDIPGWNPDRPLNRYQFAGLRWALENGKGILSYDVGVGKTPATIALIALLKAQGRAKRPLIVVPKSLTANWAAEIEAFRPGSKVLVIGETHRIDPKTGKVVAKSDNATERAKKWHRVMQEEFDYILVTQPAFNEIDLDPIKKWEYASNDFWTQRAEELGQKTDRERRKMREAYEQAIATKDFKQRSNAIYFNDLGIDLLVGEEAHGYKNLFEARSRRGSVPKFMGGSGFAKRALDFNFKSRYVLDTNGGQGVFGLTATPTKNSPLEVYSMMMHIAPEEFEKRGIRNSEEFIDRYCVIEERDVLGVDGEVGKSSVVTGFKNMNELRSVMGRYLYRKTAEDVGLQLPARETLNHYVPMDEKQEALYAELREAAAEALAQGETKTGDEHIFSVMDRMAKVALDLRLHNEDLAGEDYVPPKYKKLGENILKGIQDGGQIVFVEPIQAQERIKRYLVSLGIPEKQIGIINAQIASDSAKRHATAEAFREGKLKVVIGNTATMGEGVNLQKFTSDIHHVDIPWEPASVQQRNGRGIRQGNKLKSVRVHSYLSKRSFDGYRWQTVSGKRDWMDQLWNGGDRLENLAAQQALDSREEMMIAMSEDPDAAREAMLKEKSLQQAKIQAMKIKEMNRQFSALLNIRQRLGKLGNKQSPSVQRLRDRAVALEASLRRSPDFKHKELLDAEVPVHMTSDGQIFYPGLIIKSREKGRSHKPLTYRVDDITQHEIVIWPLATEHFPSTSEPSRLKISKQRANEYESTYEHIGQDEAILDSLKRFGAVNYLSLNDIPREKWQSLLPAVKETMNKIVEDGLDGKFAKWRGEKVPVLYVKPKHAKPYFLDVKNHFDLRYWHDISAKQIDELKRMLQDADWEVVLPTKHDPAFRELVKEAKANGTRSSQEKMAYRVNQFKSLYIDHG